MGMINERNASQYEVTDAPLFGVNEFIYSPIFPTAIRQISSNNDGNLFRFEFFVSNFQWIRFPLQLDLDKAEKRERKREISSSYALI